MKPLFNDAFLWLSNHWVAVALIISEIAALLPIRVKGIIQGIIAIIGAVIPSKQNASKKTKS